MIDGVLVPITCALWHERNPGPFRQNTSPPIHTKVVID